MDILDEIVAKRKADIAVLGYSYGCEVPERRGRAAPVPFIAQKGAVLEVKRASPSKGDIAPGLDAGKTAACYAAAGAAAVSVLTERNFFKGSLDDLRAVCRAVDEAAAASGKTPAAVLRKDFLLCPEEVDVAYRCGADAVLLIARILSTEQLILMAQRCAALGMTAFIELRLEEDVEKLRSVAAVVDKRFIVCGVNSRDLSTFTIDLLVPAGLLATIRSIMGADARVVFESGIRTPRAAAFAGSLGFTGMLLGEAAARSPGEAAALVSAFTGSVVQEGCRNAQTWLRYAAKVRERSLSGRQRPFVKICGLTSADDAVYAAGLGADFLGFVFSAGSPRCVSAPAVNSVVSGLEGAGYRSRVFTVGVVTDMCSAEGQQAFSLLNSGVLDFVQLHGCMQQFLGTRAAPQGQCATSAACVAHYGAVHIMEENDIAQLESLGREGEPRILIDACTPSAAGGTGIRIADGLVAAAAKKTRLWLAGGVTPGNAGDITARFCPELLDVASGVESSPGCKDKEKLSALFRALEP